MKRETSAKIMMIASMAVFGTIGVFRANINISSAELALYRGVLALIIIGAFLLFKRQKIDLRAIGKRLPVLIISGAAIGVNWILLFEAYRYTTVSVATLSYYFAPVIVTVVCPIIFKEKMGWKQWVCFGASTVGIVLITGVGALGAGNHLLGILFGLGAAVFYATVIILNKFVRDVDGIQRTFIQFVSAVAVLIPYVIFTGGSGLGSLDGGGWACLLVVGLIHTGVTYCLYFTAIKELPGQKAAILSYIDPLVAVLCSVIILHEQIEPLQIVGGVLILGFTLWNEIDLPKGRRAKRKEPQAENSESNISN
ncbi:MAG: DMT family transporter [Clostridia bacterium]|nr:DMT family transporter [Clostridia bacterium]